MKLFFTMRYWLTTALLVLGCWCSGVHAVCNVAPTALENPISFGTVPSRDVPLGNISPNGGATATHFYADCSITLSLSLLTSAGWMAYTVVDPLELEHEDGDKINYVIASTPSYSPVISTQGGSIGGTGGFNLLGLTVLANTEQIRIPIYIRTTATTIWPKAGLYTGTQRLAVTGRICEDIGLAGLCIGLSNLSGTVTMNLSLQVNKSCEFSSVSSQVNFGSVSFLDDAETQYLSASVQCSDQEDYIIYADNGDHYSGGSRQLDDGNGNRISYGIFHPADPSTPLTSTNHLAALGDGKVQTYSFPVIITPGQTTPTSGIYKDNVRLVLEY